MRKREAPHFTPHGTLRFPQDQPRVPHLSAVLDTPSLLIGPTVVPTPKTESNYYQILHLSFSPGPHSL
uniref:Uncharacterized protein n=1 Tax=Cucumis melo TaxID=3656 RepID=A0A9I9E7I3_CUCME